jgi:sulfate/thiosulfate-binding protein
LSKNASRDARADASARSAGRASAGKLPALLVLLCAIALTACGGDKPAANAKQIQLLNVSYDPTRELYRDINDAFARRWKEKSGQTVTIQQSHAGSGKQARAVIDGLEADVVTLALAWDIDAISDKAHLLPAGWQSRFPQNSCPYVSTVVFVVRKGNPKKISDWSDLGRPGISIITPNPKTSGGARWNYLAAWGSVLYGELGGDWSKLANPGDPHVVAAQARAEDFVKRLFRNVVVLDSGARGATTSFAQRGMGDVLLAWENEAFLTMNELGRDRFELVVPRVSILAEPPVAVVDRFAAKHGTLAVADAYLRFLYTDEAQEIIARHFYRPRAAAVAAKHAGRFPAVSLFTIDQAFGGWPAAQAKHFADGGVFDRIYQAGGR